MANSSPTVGRDTVHHRHSNTEAMGSQHMATHNREILPASPPGQYYGGGPGYQQQQPQRTGGGGPGMAGGAALGLGAGLVGGMLIENAIDNHDQAVYDQGTVSQFSCAAPCHILALQC